MSNLGDKLDEYAFKERLELVSLMKIEDAVEFARDGGSLDHKLAH